MLENAITICPYEYWNTGRMFWNNAYHCLFFLDYDLSMDVNNFFPPPSFNFSEFEDVMPDKVYSKLNYWIICNQTAINAIN
jgi:hypothetical protein